MDGRCLGGYQCPVLIVQLKERVKGGFRAGQGLFRVNDQRVRAGGNASAAGKEQRPRNRANQ